MSKPDHLPESNQLSDEQLEPIVGGLSSNRVRPTREEGEKIMLDRMKSLGVNSSDLNDANKVGDYFRT